MYEHWAVNVNTAGWPDHFSNTEAQKHEQCYFLFSDEKKVTKEKSPAAANQPELFARNRRKNNSASPQTDFCFEKRVLRVLFRLFCIGRLYSDTTIHFLRILMNPAYQMPARIIARVFMHRIRVAAFVFLNGFADAVTSLVILEYSYVKNVNSYRKLSIREIIWNEINKKQVFSYFWWIRLVFS